MQSKLSWIDVKQLANQLTFQKYGKYLSDIEIIVLKDYWEGKTYEEIAQQSGYTPDYLNKDVGNKLWKKLSIVLGEKISKKNLHEPFNRASEKQLQQINSSDSLQKDIPFPEGSVQLNSDFYVERNEIESLCCKTIIKPGALIRIKAPKLMGKTSLMNRILAYCQSQNYNTVYLDFGSVDRSILRDLDKLLQWLCLMVCRQLELDNKLSYYWDSDILGSNGNCTVYFEEFILPAIDDPLVLGLDEIDQVFPHSEVVADFLGMLRGWHEKTKVSKSWGKLGLAMAHSTECYTSLDMNQSPFNAGIPVELREFNQKQIKDLAYLHKLDLTDSQVERLMEMIGGHPYLVRLALYDLSFGEKTLEQLLGEVSTESGIYNNHLRRLLGILQQSSELVQAFKRVIWAYQPVELDSMQIYKLYSMGLVQRQNNSVIPRCNLYRDYFCRVLSVSN